MGPCLAQTDLPKHFSGPGRPIPCAYVDLSPILNGFTGRGTQSRESDRRTIIDMNKQIGVLRQAGEMAGQQIQLLLSRIDELLSLLREHGIQLPAWAHPIT